MRPPWYRRPEFWLLVVLVLAVQCTRLDDGMLHGEETRRATVAMQMLRTGDWIVPNLQGELHFMSNRPPMQQWLIAILGTMRGDVDAVAVRLPSAMAVLATTLMIFAYGCVFLSRGGAFAAAAAYATMAQVLEIGPLGESDALLTTFVTSSLLLWHIGFMRGWPPLRTWVVAYVCVALAALTKGPQGPVYFAASVGLFLLCTRNWRYALTLQHAAGIGVFVLVWGSWMLPLFLRTDLHTVQYLYFGDVVRYGTDRQLVAIAQHLGEYPLRLFACLLPWSILLTAFARRDVRRSVGDMKPTVLFCLGAILITLPSVWWIVGAKSRFYMPMYPLFAILFGIVFQRTTESMATTQLRRNWSQFAAVASVLLPLVGLVVVAAPLLGGWSEQLAQPRGFAVAFLVASIIFGLTLWRVRSAGDLRQQVLGVTCVAGFCGLVMNGVVRNIDVARSTDKPEQIARVRSLIPESATLWSLGDVDHGFAYFYRDRIRRTVWPDKHLPAGIDYFVFTASLASACKPLDFAWEPLGLIDAATTRHAGPPEMLIVVAHRLPGAADPRPLRDVLATQLVAYEATQPTLAPGS